MTVKQMIKKARYVYGWVCISEHDGKYIQIIKSNLLLVVKYNEDIINKDKFVMRNGDLYVN